MMTFADWLRGFKIIRFLWRADWFQKWVVRTWWSIRYRNQHVRFSISALVRVRVDGRYLLVKNRKWDRFQPVGGVLKRSSGAKAALDEFRVLDDDMLPIDDISRGDLRVRVPGKRIPKFLKWYDSARSREDDPKREFKEELFDTGILDGEHFGEPFIHRLRQHVNGVKPCPHLDGKPECKIAEIYDLEVTPQQEALLRELGEDENGRYIWADEALIRRRGVDPKVQVVETITDTSEWLFKVKQPVLSYIMTD